MHNCKERQSDARNKLSTSAFIMTSVIKELYLPIPKCDKY